MDKNKFRFWHKRKKEFIEPYNVQFKKSGDISNQYSAIEISQYSGLKDSTNKEIYEGDIIIDYRKHSSILQFWYCRFANGSFSFFNGEKRMIDVDTTSFEVVGNIYANEEMQEKVNFYINFQNMGTELKTGNWVETKCKMSYYTTMQESSFTVPFDKNYKRIKLTEKWLEMLQFEWRPCSWVGSLYRCKTIKGLTVFIDRNGLFRAEYLDTENYITNQYLEYVDELQNITKYWSGLELEYKT